MAGGKAGEVTVPGQSIRIREIHDLPEIQQAVALQKTVWGYDDIDVIPERVFVVATRIGGQLLGAFEGTKMVAFLLALPGIRHDGVDAAPMVYLHSQMLGVLDGYRDHGLGRTLKLRQREDAMARGISLIQWTFDPLEPRNAFFNIERLGAIVRRYAENHYGHTSSALQAGLPTDRFIAEWWITSDRVNRVLTGGGSAPEPILERISVPADIGEWKGTEPERARAVQKEIGARCADAFARGLAIVGLKRGDGVYEYLLGRWK